MARSRPALAMVMSVAWNVIVSARVTDVRIAQQMGVLLILSLAGIYICGEINLIQLGDTDTLLIIAGVLAAVGLLLVCAAKSTVRKEEILAKWR